MATLLNAPAPLAASVLPADWSLADLVAHLGGIPLERIHLTPPIGTATEQDVIDVQARTDRLCELIDGVLVEKTMGYFESLLAIEISHLIKTYLDSYDLGIVLGADGTLRILPKQVRAPDVCFISWDRFPGRKLPDTPIPDLAPDLAIEVLSPSNTPGEMGRKLRDYFTAGVRLVWYIDPRTRSATVYEAEDQGTELNETGVLSGGAVLPGFELSLQTLFAKLPEQA